MIMMIEDVGDEMMILLIFDEYMSRWLFWEMVVLEVSELMIFANFLTAFVSAILLSLFLA